MKDGILTVLVAIFIIGVVVAGIFGLAFGGLWMKKFFGPKYKEVEREIWEESPSRVRGAVQEISNRYIEYQGTNDSIEKRAICSVLRTEYPNLNPTQIDDMTLRHFFENCKYTGG
jgi:hypothetical protein